jgi:hypothetical protein
MLGEHLFCTRRTQSPEEKKNYESAHTFLGIQTMKNVITRDTVKICTSNEGVSEVKTSNEFCIYNTIVS